MQRRTADQEPPPRKDARSRPGLGVLGGKADSAATRLAPAIIQPRAGTKKDRLVSLLSKKAGADVAALSAALGWQAHTTRAALTRLRQAGFPLEAAKPAGGGATVYRIAPGAKPAGGAE